MSVESGIGMGGLGSRVRDSFIYPGPNIVGEVFHCFAADSEMSRSSYFSRERAGHVMIGATAIANALANCVNNRGDMIVLHGSGGDFAVTTAHTVDKGRLLIVDRNVWQFGWAGLGLPADSQITFTPAATANLFTGTQANVGFYGLDVRVDATTAQATVYNLADAAAANCAIVGGQIVVTVATTLVIGVDSDGADLLVKGLKFLAGVTGAVAHVGVRCSATRPHIEGCRFVTVSAAAGCRGVHLDNTLVHDGKVVHNTFHMTGGTADEGVVIASGADYNEVTNNLFHASLSDNIDDSGTGTLKDPNIEGTLTAHNSANVTDWTLTND